MKSDAVILLIILFAATKAAKFPYYSSHEEREAARDEILPTSSDNSVISADESEEVGQELPNETDVFPVTEEVIPATANTFIEDCDFCNDFMLGDCICEDLMFCKEQSCYVPEKCDIDKCEENEEVGQEVPSETIPITEEVVPVTANTLGEGSEECQYCDTFVGDDCHCEDENWCRQLQCSVPRKCSEKCLPEQTESDE